VDAAHGGAAARSVAVRLAVASGTGAVRKKVIEEIARQ